mmetsp:Transcript_8981/g.13439  ORF Transcript_8981/g.13439 Transcript_8981/m.13439 type:complete len:375 (-) Transcript_8981:146-1270(-)
MEILHIYTCASALALSFCVKRARDASAHERVTDSFESFFDSKMNILVLLNMCYTLMFLFARFLQGSLFGSLSDREFKTLRDRTLNYLLFKVVFMGAILNADLHELSVWTTWFAIMCFLRAFIIICRERLEIAAFQGPQPSSTSSSSCIYVSILFCICAINAGLVLLCWNFLGEEVGSISVIFLLLFENLAVFIVCFQEIMKFCLRIGVIEIESSQQRSLSVHYVDYVGDCVMQIVTLAHYVHVWNMYGVSFTLIDLFLFMNMRSVFINLQKRILAFQSYRRAMEDVDTKFSDATKEELKNFDKCAICLEKMHSAKKLGCSHQFHRECLERWIKFRRICPCCRAPIAPVSRTKADNRAVDGSLYFIYRRISRITC